MPDAVERDERCGGTSRKETAGHGVHRNRIERAPHDTERRRVLLDRAREPFLFGPAVFDVADRASQQRVAVVVGGERPLRVEFFVARGVFGGERQGQAGAEPVARVEPEFRDIHPRVVEAEQKLLARRELRHLDVDAAVRQQPLRDCERQLAVEVAGEKLAADRVAHVVGHEPEPVAAHRGDDAFGDVGVHTNAVAHVGLVGQAEPGEVEKHNPPVRPQFRKDVDPVVRTRREAVEDQQRIVTRVAIGGNVDDENLPAADVDVAAARPPFLYRAGSGLHEPSLGGAPRDAPGSVSVVPAVVVPIEPLFDTDAAAAMVDLCERFGRYRMYLEHERLETDIGAGLAQRQDALQNFLRTGGLAGAREPVSALAVRTSYFREEYAYGRDARISGIEPFLHHPGFLDAARAIHGRPVVEPAIAYANLMIPGQELAVHTDVPEFRGANRKVIPQWLLVVMKHSGLFDTYRMPIATGIAWFHDCDGGELAYWPDGADGSVARHAVRYNTAMVLDTDTVFHGVDRIADVAPDALPPLRPGMTLDYDGARAWTVRDAQATEIARYDWAELRFSVSWKAYCFRDERECDTWRDHADDLTLDVILDHLVDDLCERGRVDDRNVTRDGALGALLIDEYIAFPVSTARSTG